MRFIPDDHRLISRKEALCITIGAAITTVLGYQFDWFQRLFDFFNAHRHWRLGELSGMVFFIGFGSFFPLVRRGRDLHREVERRKAAEARAHRLARHDPLTGLANRRLLHEEFAQMIERARVDGAECATFLIDLDRFKAVNDIHGHSTGDELLVQVAERLVDLAEPGAIVARLGGDEFVYAFTYSEGSGAPARLAAQIVRTFADPIIIGQLGLEIEATVGVARFPIDGGSPADLIRMADIAMYEAKRAGRGAYCFFHADMDAQLRDRAALEADLRHAVERGQIKAYFQPIVSFTDQRIMGFEALARWDHPERGMMDPDDFIPIAEDLRLIDVISYEILRQGCLASRDWPQDVSLSVNVAPIQIRDSWFPSRILAILTETGFPPSRLILEITENALIDDFPSAIELFRGLQNAGVRIALDDFGKGYSSLNHLRQLQFDHLKIDSSFVMSLDTPESEKIVRAITALGKSLGMPVTAEGVETELSAAALHHFGCEQGQGFLYSVPVAAIATRQLFDDVLGQQGQTRVALLRAP